ncbi:hypothetical protein ES319_A08G273000v1 [Gossypium barbadense]|uniref:Uncharacterized protein n=2 Tax=Gossypium TaxID=3633 RepID=A0A5J5UXC2_GOSBA|nr:hypothetical protein ES319_A08G273000v1 [Gossypium barbadense]TYH08233.1 hypothetical protein ES288_A08G299700v1 [Gossypium darwinii]
MIEDNLLQCTRIARLDERLEDGVAQGSSSFNGLADLVTKMEECMGGCDCIITKSNFVMAVMFCRCMQWCNTFE